MRGAASGTAPRVSALLDERAGSAVGAGAVASVPVRQGGRVRGQPGLGTRQDLAGLTQRDDASTIAQPVARAFGQLIEIDCEQGRSVVEAEQHRLVVGLRRAL